MLFYHGTTKTAAEKIFNEGRIRVTDAEIARYKTGSFNDTDFGYVYLADNINVAWGYAVNKDDDNTFCVFKISLDENEVEEDIDNLKERAIVSELYQDGSGCFRIDRNLVLGSDVIEFFMIRVEDRNKRHRLADFPNAEGFCTQKWRKIAKRH